MVGRVGREGGGTGELQWERGRYLHVPVSHHPSVSYFLPFLSSVPAKWQVQNSGDPLRGFPQGKEQTFSFS